MIWSPAFNLENPMKLAPFVLCVVSLALFSNASGQMRFYGTVSEVIDGQTLVINTDGRTLTVQLQYIATPSSGQPLYDMVRSHLSTIALGKSVEFKLIRLGAKVAVGKVTMHGSDISMQLIRDGAAWHEPTKTSGQAAAEASEYDSNQQQAKNEKRGIWSVPGLKTPWQIQAEIDEEIRRKEAAIRQSRPNLVGVSQFQTANRTDLPNTGPASASAKPGQTLDGRDAWVSVLSGADKEAPGLKTYRDPGDRYDVLYTSASFVELSQGGQRQKLECRAAYVTYKQVNGMIGASYMLGFRAISEDYRFSRQKSRLTVVVDNQAISLGLSRGLLGQTAVGAVEMMFYQMNKATLRKISNARSVEFRIDGAKAVISEDIKALFKELSNVTE